MKKKKRILLLVIIGVVVVAGGGFAVWKKTHPNQKITSVTVEAAAVRNLVSTVSATGKVEPVDQVKISAEIPGRIVQLPVKEGDRVEKGQFLVELDPETYVAAMYSASSALRSARAQKEKADADYRRMQELVTKGMASQADLDAAKANSELYAGQLDQASAEENRARENLSKTHIVSPMSGSISQLNKEVGELTLGSQFQEDVIMIVADLSRMQVRAEVDENDIVGVNVGDSAAVEIDAFPDTVFHGRVEEISQSAKTLALGTQEEATNFDVKVAIVDQIAGIRPGMSATVDVATDYADNALSVSLQCVAVRDKKEGTAVEITAKPEAKSSRQIAQEVRAGTADTSARVTREQLEEGVFVLVADSAVWKPVKTGISSDRHMQVLSGIAAGDTVINGPYRVLARELKNGSKVSTQKPDSSKKG